MTASERLEAALAKTTPGEWHAVEIAGCWAIQVGPNYTDKDVLVNDDYDENDNIRGVPNPGDNANFIALAHNLLPALLAEVRTLRGFADGLDKLCVCYRLGRQPSGKLLDDIAKSRAALAPRKEGE